MPPNSLQRAATTLRDAAMTYPGAHEDFPWGEVAIKVNNKVFLFMYSNGETLSLSCKLPQSSDMALMLPFAKPTGYGLGKSGWVSASFKSGDGKGEDAPPVELLREWIDESYRAVAPKKLVAELGGAAAEERAVKAGGAGKVAKTGGAAATTGKAGGAGKAGKTGGAAKVAKTGGAAKVAKTGGAAATTGKAGGAGKTGGAGKVAKTGGAGKVAKAGGAGKAGGAAAKKGSAVTKAAKAGGRG